MDSCPGRERRTPALSAGLGMVLGLVLLLVLMAGGAPAQATQPVGQVTALTGPATVVRDGVSQTLRRDAAVYAQDRVRTQADSRLEVTFTDGTLLVLGSGSEVALAAYAPAPRAADTEATGSGNVLLDLAQGVLRVLTGPVRGYDRFDIRTSNVVASARLTHWIVGVSEDGDDTAVFVVDGRVSVAAAGESVQLQPGEGTDVFAGAPPLPATRWSQARIDQVFARTGLK